MNDELHVNDIGAALAVTMIFNGSPLDISTASVTNFVLRRPDGVNLIVAASFVNTGTDGQLQYVTLAGDIACAGLWRLQAQIMLGADTLNSEVTSFTVYPNL